MSTIALVLLLLQLHLQSPAAEPNLIFGQLMGSAGLYSLNYERTVFEVAQQHTLSLRAGASFLPSNVPSYPSVFVLPLSAQYLYGSGPHYLQAGGGITPRVLTAKRLRGIKSTLYPLATIGYRFIQPGTGSCFGVAFEPLFFTGFTPWMGVSFGRTF
jgi:hypothetical protein